MWRYGLCPTNRRMPTRGDRDWFVWVARFQPMSSSASSVSSRISSKSAERGSTTITAIVQTLADGRIQVKFDSKGPGGADAGLVQQVSDNYDRRMGR